MCHFDKDTLYKYALDLLDDSDSKFIREHLKECELCEQKYNEIKDELDVISSYNPELKIDIPQLPKQGNSGRIWLKRAAVLFIGFLLGYSTSTLMQPDKVEIVGQSFIPRVSYLDSTQFIECQNVDIYNLKVN